MYQIPLVIREKKRKKEKKKEGEKLQYDLH